MMFLKKESVLISPLRIFGIVWLFFGVLAGSAAGESLEESRRQLEAIQRRIEDTSQALEKKQAQKESLSADLNTVEKELGRIQTRMKRLNGEIVALGEDLQEKERRVAQARQNLEGLQKKVRKRLVALYKGGDSGGVRVLFAGRSPVRIAEDYHYWGAVVRRDRELLSDFRGELDTLQAALEQLEELTRRRQQTLAERQKEQDALRSASRLKEKLLARASREERTLAAKLEELRERAGRLGSLVKKLESEKQPEYSGKTGVFTSLKGKLPWPVGGAVKVAFGTSRHPDLGTLFESNGLEIGVAEGEPISAVWGGRVAFANWFKGYGNLLIIDHGESFFTLYAQASRLNKKVGEQVREGETIGISGFEGSRTLYFEIRQGGTPLDPQAWLKKR